MDRRIFIRVDNGARIIWRVIRARLIIKAAGWFIIEDHLDDAFSKVASMKKGKICQD